jgi:hypothetical protein
MKAASAGRDSSQAHGRVPARRSSRGSARRRQVERFRGYACSICSISSWSRSTDDWAPFARRQPGCRALIEQLHGVGPVSATAILAELGDCRRFSSSDDAVRHAASTSPSTVRRQARPRPSLARGARAVALRALRGRGFRRPRRLTRPRLLPPGRSTARERRRGIRAGFRCGLLPGKTKHLHTRRSWISRQPTSGQVGRSSFCGD